MPQLIPSCYLPVPQVPHSGKVDGSGRHRDPSCARTAPSTAWTRGPRPNMGTFLKAVNKPAKEGCLFSSSFIFLRALPLSEIGLKAATVGGQAWLRSPRRLGWHWAAPAADPSRARGESGVSGCHQTPQPTARSPGTRAQRGRSPL